jgi:hypothetical protein
MAPPLAWRIMRMNFSRAFGCSGYLRWARASSVIALSTRSMSAAAVFVGAAFVAGAGSAGAAFPDAGSAGTTGVAGIVGAAEAAGATLGSPTSST